MKAGLQAAQFPHPSLLMQILCHTSAMVLSHVNYMCIVTVIKMKMKGKSLLCL